MRCQTGILIDLTKELGHRPRSVRFREETRHEVVQAGTSLGNGSLNCMPAVIRCSPGIVSETSMFPANTHPSHTSACIQSSEEHPYLEPKTRVQPLARCHRLVPTTKPSTPCCLTKCSSDIDGPYKQKILPCSVPWFHQWSHTRSDLHPHRGS